MGTDWGIWEVGYVKPCNHWQEGFGFYFNSDGKSLKGFKQEMM